MTYDATRGPARPDPSSAAITGLTTLAWYAVPDLVRPRWARALTKAAVAVAGLGAGLVVTTEGRSARDGLRAAMTVSDAADVPEGVDGRGGRQSDENGVPGVEDESLAQVDPRLAGAVVAGSLAAGVALAVAGEKWAYRRGEKWRAKGLTLPHTRVGLIVGAAAAGLTLLEPARAVEDDREVDDPVAPRAPGARQGRR